jgi:AsmA protein
MPGSAAARGIWAIAIALLVVAIVAVGLPYVASNLILREGIARQLSAWSGYRVTLESAPTIHVWPSFSADLDNVVLSPWDADAPPAIEAEQVHIDLSALAALTGETVFTRVRLVRPTIRLDARQGLFMLPAFSSGGKLETAIAAARGLLKKDPAKPDLGALPDGALATLEIQDGRIIRRAAPDGEDEEILTGLSATLDWPALDRAATVTANGIWHGEAVSIEGSSAEPLLLLAGGTVKTALTVNSAPLTMAFDGVASLARNAFVDGKLKLSSPSLKRMLEWVGAEAAPGDVNGPFEVSCNVSGGPSRLKFEKAQLAINGNPGMGVFDVSFGQQPIGISGTLAFKSLDLESIVAAFTQLPAGRQGTDGAVGTVKPGQFDVDLRLSAASAKAGEVALSDVAATAQVKGGLAAFDISDAKAFGGSLQFGLRVDRKWEGTAVELRLVAENIDGAAAAEKLGWPFLPHARGSSSIIIKGTGARWEEVFSNAEGSITASFGKGEIPGIDLKTLRARSAKGGFFPLSGVESSALPIDKAELKATVVNGVARIDHARATSDTTRVTVGGLVPLAGGGLALSGWIAPTDPKQANAGAGGVPKLAFFIGGSWSSPFFSPVLPGLPPG